MSGKCALVTAGDGFIGSHLVAILVSAGLTVRIFDIFRNGRTENIVRYKGNLNVELLRVDSKKNSQVIKKTVTSTKLTSRKRSSLIVVTY